MAAPLLTFYGDDFTGASAVMEVLSFAGVPTMLFLAPPDADMLQRYPDLQAVGVAGIARSKDPAWMRAHLPGIFEALARLGAPLVHYKTCSTFDSAPHVGSVGVAAEIGAAVLQPDWIPLVVGAPPIGRYQLFGTLFAAAPDGAIHRLDRHPVMARHPVTPMDEADLGRHLARQTDLPVGVVDYVSMAAGTADAALASARSTGARIVALDAMDAESLRAAGRLLWRDGQARGFAIGSQGVEYALVAHLRATGRLAQTYEAPVLAPVDQLFAVSGSCAETTSAQIARAAQAGFVILDFEAAAATQSRTLQSETERVLQAALHHLAQGRDVLVSTARGPDDPAVARMGAAASAAHMPLAEANAHLGAALGQLVAEIRLRTALPRVAIAGGDTSGHALSALRADAISAIAPLAPGAPLCRIHSRVACAIDGLEVTLKGGQMGAPDFFLHTKTGGT